MVDDRRNRQREKLMLQLNSAHDESDRMHILKELVDMFGDEMYCNEYERLLKKHKEREEAREAVASLSASLLKAICRTKIFWIIVAVFVGIILMNIASSLGFGGAVILLLIVLILFIGVKCLQWYNNE